MKKLFLLFCFLALSFTSVSATSLNAQEDNTVNFVEKISLDLDFTIDSQSGLVFNLEFEQPEKTCFIQANEKAISYDIEKRKAKAQKEHRYIVKNSEAPPLYKETLKQRFKRRFKEADKEFNKIYSKELKEFERQIQEIEVYKNKINLSNKTTTSSGGLPYVSSKDYI